MVIESRVWGVETVADPLVRALLETPEMERLKDIDSAGYLWPFIPGYRYSRWEHSVGVYLLLKRYHAPREEQIAGLLHDVSHTAFSHCVDYVYAHGDGAEQNFQDLNHETYLRRSGLPALLAAHELTLEAVVDDSRHPLKENNLPDLCADRIDYSFLALVVMQEISSAEKEALRAALRVENQQWVFADYELARRFAELFRLVNQKYFSGVASAVMFAAMGGYLRQGLTQGYLTEADLYTTDRLVLDKLAPYHAQDAELRKYWARLNAPTPYVTDAENYETRVVCKSRLVDPWCWRAGQLTRVSTVDPEWGETLRREKEPRRYDLRWED